MLNKNKFFICLLLVLSVSVFAATDTDVLNLQGFVGDSVDVTVSPAPLASNLNLNAPGVNILVASVNEKSNVAAGYTVTLTALNGTLLNTVTGTDLLNYTVSYGTLTGADLVAATPQTATDVSAATVAAGVDKNVNISYATGAALPAGTYTETITFTITSK